ncbi:MAG: hypothetical protein MHM6MM_002278 [Cercozoa sp. M6MM]
MRPWLVEAGSCDVVCVGTQECQRSIRGSFFKLSKRRWEKHLLRELRAVSYERGRTDDELHQVASVTLVAIHLSVFVRRSLLPFLAAVHTGTVATGALHKPHEKGVKLGNKGAVYCALHLCGTRFLVLNSHLHAHHGAKHVRRRNAECYAIMRQLRVPENFFRAGIRLRACLRSFHLFKGEQSRLGGHVLLSPESLSYAEAARRYTSLRFAEFDQTEQRRGCLQVHPVNDTVSTSVVMERFDAVIWTGDLNYRINGNRGAVDHLIERGMMEVLRANDQLSHQREHGLAFTSFQEGPLSFAPTYKFDPDSDTYDSSSKRRVPGWTDRVLYRNKSDALPVLKLLQYTRYSKLFDPFSLSDGEMV